MNKKILVNCPKCGKLLLKASENATGTVYPYCKRCKEEQEIKLNPKEV